MSNGSSNMATTIITSVLVSALVTVGILYGTGNLRMPNAAPDDSAKIDAAAPTTTVETPSLLGLTTGVAADVLKARNLRLVVQQERADNDVAPGQICEQTPLANSMLTEGGTVSVVVSTGPELIAVPDVSGKSVEEAKQALTVAGFAIGEMVETDTGTPDTVVSTAPEKGSLENPGVAVNITVTKVITVPKVVGSNVSKAKKTLTEAGLTVGKIKRGYSDYVSYNAVMTQTPKADETVAPGTEVELVINAD